jgi:hypothetical protein
MSRVVRSRLVAALLLVALALAGTDGAAASSAREQPAFDQYVPSLPSADGSAPSADDRDAAAPLPHALRERLAQRADGALLRAVAEERELGAPPAAELGRSAAGAGPAPSGEVGSALWEAAGSGAGLALVAGLAVVLLGAAVPLLRRGRIRRRSQ